MYLVKDKNGVQIFLRDTVKYEAEQDDMGLLGEEEGTALLFPEEGTVQVQSLKGGVPVMLQSDQLEVTYSLVQKIAELGSNEELQELILNAEVRYDKAVADTKKPRKSGKAKKEAKPNPFAAVKQKEG